MEEIKKKECVHKDHRKRLRDKFLKDPDSLSEAELLELLLFYVIPRKNTSPIARGLLNRYGSLNGVLTTAAEDLKRVEGLGEQSAAFLIGIGKICEKISDSKFFSVRHYTLASFRELLMQRYGNKEEEVFVAIYLSKNSRVLKIQEFTTNKRKQVDVPVQDLVESFALLKPYAVVIAHNHPNGILSPSMSDDRTTQKLYMTFKLSGVLFYDHIIVTADDIYSFREHGTFERLDKKIDTFNGELL